MILIKITFLPLQRKEKVLLWRTVHFSWLVTQKKSAPQITDCVLFC